MNAAGTGAAIRTISYIIPCFNEADVLPELYRRVAALAQEMPSYKFEYLFVNDGSTDGTAEILNHLASTDRRVRVLHFARNRGHQPAITAGMDFAAGDVIVIIDADLQDPPELLKEILPKIHEGYHVVHMQRKQRRGEKRGKLFFAWVFYKIMKLLTPDDVIENSGDFRAFTRPVLKTVQGFREEHRYIRGIFGMLGFRQCTLQYDRDARYAGWTKYSTSKMVQLAFNGILNLSSAPIKAISWFAILSWLISLIYLVKALIEHFVYKATVQGWTSIIILLTFFTGVIIFSISIIGSYVGKIFEQSRHRPLYWLSDARNIDLHALDVSIREVSLSEKVLGK